eukprot:scaffold598_cov318-Pavlova_lutheri.AAC.8
MPSWRPTRHPARPGWPWGRIRPPKCGALEQPPCTTGSCLNRDPQHREPAQKRRMLSTARPSRRLPRLLRSNPA